MKLIRSNKIRCAALVSSLAMVSCAHNNKPFISLGHRPSTGPAVAMIEPSTESVVATSAPMVTTAPVATSSPVATSAPTVSTAPVINSAPAAATAPVASSAPVIVTAPPAQPAAIMPPVATSELGTIRKVPGLAPKPKPFIAIPKPLQVTAGRPSTLLLEHASPDSPIPLSDYATQPVYTVAAFHLKAALSAEQVQKLMGPPAQLADTEDPWFVYRLHSNQELWLHFSGPFHDHLDAADVIRGAEDGYVRTRVFSTDDSQ